MHFTDLLATLPPELRAYVRALETRAATLEMQTATLEMQASALQARNQFLEEQFRLAQLKRFAPSSEKFGAQGCCSSISRGAATSTRSASSTVTRAL